MFPFLFIVSLIYVSFHDVCKCDVFVVSLNVFDTSFYIGSFSLNSSLCCDTALRWFILCLIKIMFIILARLWWNHCVHKILLKKETSKTTQRFFFSQYIPSPRGTHVDSIQITCKTNMYCKLSVLTFTLRNVLWGVCLVTAEKLNQILIKQQQSARIPKE